jgi:hypothetical protein
MQPACVSQQELEQSINIASELQQSVTLWLNKNYPELTIRS